MKTNRTFWITVSGTLICAVFALLFFGLKFDDANRPPFYFLMLGFAGSLSLSLFMEKKVRDVIYINILIYFFFAIVASLIKPITAVILLIYFSAMVLALYVFVKQFERKLSRTFFARTLVLAALVGLFYIAANFIHGLMFFSHLTKMFLLANLPIGFLLGLGYGLALEGVERFVSK
ncbi:hypothetical protein JXO59_00395 [candidate division KSB1 bacterium]|nr:hypothetical protein [candidate division KSB1 bacterium]